VEWRFYFSIPVIEKERIMFKRLAVWMVVVSLMVGALPALAQDDTPAVTEKAIVYLQTVQNEDGGFTNGFAPESDLGTTADVVVAIIAGTQGASEENKTALTGTVSDALGFLEDQVSANDELTAGAIAKVITALSAAGGNVVDFGGHNLIEDLLALQSEDGVFGSGAFDHCTALIALENAGADVPEKTIEALVAAQNEDGGWGFMAGEASDTNTTGLCLQALALTDSADAVQAGLAYLQGIQNEDGGWPYQSPSDYGTDSDTNSTALVTQALIANQEDLATWNNPQDWLLTMQNESGSFSYQEAVPGDNVFATVAVIPALVGMTLNAWAPAAKTAE
jgi:prenyltransferase beta subunit